MTCTEFSLASARAVLAQVCLRLRSWLWPHSGSGLIGDSGEVQTPAPISRLEPSLGSNQWVGCTPLTAVQIRSLPLVRVTTHRPLIGWGRLLGQLWLVLRGWVEVVTEAGLGCVGLTCDLVLSGDCVTVFENCNVSCVTAMWHNVRLRVSPDVCLSPGAGSHSTDHTVSPPVSDHSLVPVSLSLLSQRSSRLSPGRRTGGRLPAQARLRECLNFFCRQH